MRTWVAIVGWAVVVACAPHWASAQMPYLGSGYGVPYQTGPYPVMQYPAMQYPAMQYPALPVQAPYPTAPAVNNYYYNSAPGWSYGMPATLLHMRFRETIGAMVGAMVGTARVTIRALVPRMRMVDIITMIIISPIDQHTNSHTIRPRINRTLGILGTICSVPKTLATSPISQSTFLSDMGRVTAYQERQTHRLVPLGR